MTADYDSMTPATMTPVTMTADYDRAYAVSMTADYDSMTPATMTPVTMTADYDRAYAVTMTAVTVLTPVCPFRLWELKSICQDP